MKAVTINVSINPELAEFAEADLRAEAFGSLSEYVGDLIRRRRQERIAADVKLLEQAIAGAPVGDPSEGEMREIYSIAKRGRRKS